MTRLRATDWPPERVAVARELWALVPRLTCAQIGARMGLSKNCIVGVAHRNGFPPRAVGPLAGVKQAPRRPKGPKLVVPPQKLALGPLLPNGSRGPARTRCAWPMWADGAAARDRRYCGAAAILGRSYCLIHWRIAYPPRPRVAYA